MTNYTIWAEIDISALKFNICQIRERIGLHRKILIAVKADGYGHGAIEVARTCLREGVEMLGVATMNEAVELCQAGITCPILMLVPSLTSQIDSIIENDIIPNISTMEFARSLSQRAANFKRSVKAHIEVDTGMGRTGINYKEAPASVSRIVKLPNLKIEGIFTHFPVADSAEDKNRKFTLEQIDRFFMVMDELKKDGVEIPIKHASNSAAILDYPQSYFDMVRPGIMVYGLYPSKEVSRSISIKPVMNLKAKVIQLQKVEPGWSIGYGRTFVAQKEMLIATIQAGYGDGYRRHLSNRGEVLVRGRRCPLVGIICMDMSMIDVSDVPGVKLEDEAVLVGSQGNDEITADEVARKIGTINYEVTTAISKRVPRVFINRNSDDLIRTPGGDQLNAHLGGEST